jgi:hypothetical protein
MKEENELYEIIYSYGERNDSETQDSISEPSEDDISETTEDPAFVVSDAEQSAYSYRTSKTSNPNQHCLILTLLISLVQALYRME